jgi:acetyl esterase/lipase
MTLDPKAKELLDEVKASGRPNAHLLPVPEARANFEALFASLGPGEEVEEVQDLAIPVAGATIPARAYRPRGAGALPVVAYYHGGGWLLGSIEAYDIVCRALASSSGAIVVSVGYRLAPEHRFPTAVEDAYNATRWIAENAGDLGGDRHRIAVAGDSAGGNLAAVVALQARDLTRPRLAFQLLVYPVTTCDLDVGFDMAYEGYFLYRDELQWHQDNYLASPGLAADWHVSPLQATDHAGLPPAFVVTAECDPLHRQGELYAEKLRAAGVAVEQREYPGMIHGFFGLDMVFAQAAEAMRDAGAALRTALAA